MHQYESIGNENETFMLLHRLLHPAVICLLPLGLFACSQKAETDPRTKAPLVRATAVQMATSESLVFTGVVAAKVQSDLGFRVPGKVLERFVNTGQRVKRGQLLMRIDPIDLGLTARAQQEAVIAAQAQAQQTAEDEVRYRNLLGTGATSPSTYSQMKAAAEIAKSHLEAAEAQAQVARNAIQYTKLVANADGVVVETLAEPGQVVSTGQVVIRIAHAGRREAVIQLPETFHPAIGSSGHASLFAKKAGDTELAKLRQLSDAADPLTRTYEARYVLGGQLANAPLGSTVTIQVSNGSLKPQSGLQVPIGTLLDTGKGPGVWVINGNPSRVSWRAVAVQHIDNETARITGKLTQGERIVALGAHLLREGEEVRVSSQVQAAEGVDQ
jgi:RND family efflux transporter MFP subunit